MNYIIYLQSTSNDAAYQNSPTGDGSGKFKIGNLSGGGINGAVRFPSVNIPQGTTVNAAQLRMWSQFQGATTSTLKSKTYGIKETNTADFSSLPFGRTKTTAVSSQSGSRPIGGFFPADVTSQVNEILAQGGWASGNAMGFLVLDDGSSNNCEFEDWSLKEQLAIQISAPGNMTPTPETVTGVSFPAADDFGIRVSEPTKDVKTANEDELYYTTRKKELRVLTEIITGSDDPIAHGLGYAPATMGFWTDSGGKIRLMNTPSNVFSVEPFISSDGTYVYLFPDPAGDAYVYIFIDPLT